MSKRNTNGLPILIGLVLLAASCKKNGVTPKPEPPSVPPTVTTTTTNLIDNNDFRLWDSITNFFKGWTTESPMPGVIKPDSNGLAITGNFAGSYYLYQRIKVDSRKFYKAGITASYTVNNYYAGGIYVLDSSRQNIIGKCERSYSSGNNETWEIVFYNRRRTEVVLAIGFFHGIDANVVFSAASLIEYKYQPRIRSSAFSAYLGHKLQLSFTPQLFDATITRISDYVNSVLLSKFEYVENIPELPILSDMIGSDTDYYYFNQYLKQLDEITVGYCQKSSLSLGEILSNEFNIPVRQVHMVFGTEGKHQFLEYWNPFVNRWLCIDPCFNTRYVKNGSLAGTEDFDRSEAPSLMQPFGIYFYYKTTDDLITLWQDMDNLMVMDYYTITFPFSS